MPSITYSKNMLEALCGTCIYVFAGEGLVSLCTHTEVTGRPLVSFSIDLHIIFLRQSF